MNEMQRQVSDEVIRSWRDAERMEAEVEAVGTRGDGGELLRRDAPSPSPLPSPGGRGDVGWLRQPGLTGELQSEGGSVQVDAGVELEIGPMKRGGRPTVFSPELKEKLETLLAVGMSRRQAAAYVGIDHTTLVKAAARDPELAVGLRIAEEQASVNPLLTIISESRKNWRAAAWLLNHRRGWPVDRAPMTEEDKELEHQQKLADDRRDAERRNLQMAALREAVQGPPSLRNEPSAPRSEMSARQRRSKRAAS